MIFWWGFESVFFKTLKILLDKTKIFLKISIRFCILFTPYLMYFDLAANFKYPGLCMPKYVLRMEINCLHVRITSNSVFYVFIYIRCHIMNGSESYTKRSNNPLDVDLCKTLWLFVKSQVRILTGVDGFFL